MIVWGGAGEVMSWVEGGGVGDVEDQEGDFLFWMNDIGLVHSLYIQHLKRPDNSVHRRGRSGELFAL